MNAPSTPAKPWYKRRWFRVVRLILIAYLTWCTGLYCRQDTLIFPTGMIPAVNNRPINPGTEIIRIELDDGGSNEAWFIPAEGVSADAPGPVVVSFHGNAEIVNDADGLVGAYLEHGISVLLPEYRGYGSISGEPSEATIVADCVRFYDAMIQRPDVDPTRIVYHGRSLGGAVAAALTRRRKPAALILEQTFTSVAAMARSYGVPGFIARHKFKTDDVVVDLDIPLFIGHGARDRLIPVSHGRRLAALAPEADYHEYVSDHNDYPGEDDADARWSDLKTFLANAGIMPPKEE